MSTATVPPPAAGDSTAARAFLVRYTVTLLPMAAALVAVQLGAQLLPGGASTFGRGWPVSVAACWALAVVAWLRRFGWATGTLVAVGAGPAAALAIPAAAGWLSPAGLLLWGPLSTLLGVALALAAQPLPSAARRGRSPSSGLARGLVDAAGTPRQAPSEECTERDLVAPAWVGNGKGPGQGSDQGLSAWGE